MLPLSLVPPLPLSLCNPAHPPQKRAPPAPFSVAVQGADIIFHRGLKGGIPISVSAQFSRVFILSGGSCLAGQPLHPPPNPVYPAGTVLSIYGVTRAWLPPFPTFSLSLMPNIYLSWGTLLLGPHPWFSLGHQNLSYQSILVCFCFHLIPWQNFLSKTRKSWEPRDSGNQGKLTSVKVI